MDAIVEMARRLGRTIAESPQAKALRAAQEQLNTQPDVRELLEEFQNQSRKVVQLEAEKKPVEVDDKHKLQSLQNQLISKEAFKSYTAAQVEYVDLMRKVNDALQGELSATERG